MYLKLTTQDSRGLYLPKIGYFSPAPFLNNIYPLKYSENFPFSHLFPLLFEFYLSKSSYEKCKIYTQS